MDITQQTDSFLSQSTIIEQSRAVAEVQSAIVLAKKFPRNQRESMARMYTVCSRLSLASEAFYSFPRGKQQVTGPSIHFATAIAQAWGNIRYEIVELEVNRDRKETEMMAIAWDLESNTTCAQRFFVPHWIQTKEGKKELSDPRDIYERAANDGSRRLRSCILRIIPTDVVDQAEQWCRETLQKGDGKPLGDRIVDAVSAFRKIGISRDMIQEYLECLPEEMTVEQLSRLTVIYSSIKKGEHMESFFNKNSSAKKIEKELIEKQP